MAAINRPDALRFGARRLQFKPRFGGTGQRCFRAHRPVPIRMQVIKLHDPRMIQPRLFSVSVVWRTHEKSPVQVELARLRSAEAREPAAIFLLNAQLPSAATAPSKPTRT